jgi:hypothetical protein
MRSASQARRGEEKLGLILAQIGSLRARLNGLAIQQGLFESLSLIVGTGAIVFLAAFLLQPLKFLCVAIVLGAVLFVGLFRAIRRAYRMRASLERAAAIADQRASLKGRLATVVALARTAPGRAHLWAYLLEDTVSLREEFVAARVEPRRISRSIYGLLAYGLLAAVVVGFAMMHRRMQVAAKAAQANLEIDLNNLDVRSIDPDLGTEVEVTGDAAAMRKLDEKVARAGGSAGESNTALDRLLGRARDLAGDVQDRMTGQPARVRLRVTDNDGPTIGDDDSVAGAPHPAAGDKAAGSEPSDDQTPGNSPPGQNPGAAHGGAADQEQALADAGGKPAPTDWSRDPFSQQDADDSTAGGSSHGSGSDPQHLFGQAEEPPLGSEGFDIMIEARPAEHGPKGAAQSYLPPKIRAALNPQQYPDEPIARGAIPDADRLAVKRVFER